MNAPIVRLLGLGAAIAAAYVAAARLGFELAFVAEQVTTVWAPTGIAQAALVLWGRRLWPAVWAGAFIANAGTQAPIWTAALIATGNTLEAVVLASLLPRSIFDTGLSRFGDAARLIVIGAFITPMISASVGVVTLCMASVQPWSRFATLWSDWWLGDALGSLVVAPVLLTIARSVRERLPRRLAGTMMVIAVTAVVAELVFGDILGPQFGRGPLHYALFPVVIVSAIRYGQPATALVVLTASTVAIANTVRGAGPFAGVNLDEGLILLQAFMGMLAGTGLLLAAAMTEREAIRRRVSQSEEQLRAADRRKDEFLAVLAHELRNPLAPIRTGLENLRLAGDDPAVARQLRPMMERQITHMVRLIDDLLDVSRITSGKIDLQRQHVLLHNIVSAAADANRFAIADSGAELIVDLPGEPVQLFVDATRMIQVVSNLLHNAAKFTGSGGRIAIIGRVDGAGDAGHELHLEVADTGAGIDSRLLPHVFELFTQGDSTSRSGSAGLGVGLALSRLIVELHGGRIEARSAGPGQGSAFHIRLPMPSSVQPVAVAESTPVAARAPVNRRVLVVDDNADVAEMTAWLVRAVGAEVRTAADGPTALEHARTFDPDIVLLDIGLPGQDGYEVCGAIRALMSARQPLIVAITGFGQDRDKRRAAEAGFDVHLTKPVDPTVLERLLIDPATRRRVASPSGKA